MQVTIREAGLSGVAYAKPGYRLMSDANKIKLPTSQSSFDVIRECITKFKPLKMAKYKAF